MNVSKFTGGSQVLEAIQHLLAVWARCRVHAGLAATPGMYGGYIENLI